MLEGNLLFHAVDPEHLEYRRRAHLAEIIGLLGPPPKRLLSQGQLSGKFFSNEGKQPPYVHGVLKFCGQQRLTFPLGTYIGGLEVPPPTSLEDLETFLSGDDKEKFLTFMRKMLQWDPEKRSTPLELWEDEWVQGKI